MNRRSWRISCLTSLSLRITGKALVLLDEADVFGAGALDRQSSECSRFRSSFASSSIIKGSCFSRPIRVMDFDDAIQSRITLAVRYEASQSHHKKASLGKESFLKKAVTVNWSGSPIYSNACVLTPFFSLQFSTPTPAR